MSTGWDDPRMPTLAGLRRRGVPPEAIRDFVKRIGVAKANSVVDVAMFDFSIREVLNKTALRRMAVLRPLKVVIENYPEGQSEELEAVNHPDDPAAGTRRIRFGRELYVERDDFMENPPKKFFRLSPGTRGAAALCLFHHLPRGGEERGRRGDRAALHLRSGDPRRQRAGRPQGAGDDPLGLGGGRRAGGGAALQPAVHAARSRTPATSPPISIRDSLEVLTDARVEPALAGRKPGEAVQFERQGYFCLRPRLEARPARVQPHGRPARHLGEGAGGATVLSASSGQSVARPRRCRSVRARALV